MTSLTCHHHQQHKAEISQKSLGIRCKRHGNRTVNCVKRHTVCLCFDETPSKYVSPWQFLKMTRKASPSLHQINRQDVQIWVALDCPRFYPYNWLCVKSRANVTCWVRFRLVLGQIALDFICDSMGYGPSWPKTALQKTSWKWVYNLGHCPRTSDFVHR